MATPQRFPLTVRDELQVSEPAVAKDLSWWARNFVAELKQKFRVHAHLFPAVIAGELRPNAYTEASKPTAAQAKLGAIIISTDAATPPQMSDGTNWLTLGAGGGGGDNVQVNGVAVADANLHDTDPAPPADGVNVRWQLNAAPAPDRVSANVPASPNGSTAVVGTGRIISAGVGLSGGGDLSADRTLALNIKQTEIDFGATPVAEAAFTVVDADVNAGSQLTGQVAYEAPTGKDLDEVEMDALDLKFGPGAGQFQLYARGLDGYLADKFKVNYLIG